MGISGRQVDSEFRRQLERLRGQSAELATEIGRFRARVADLVEERGQAIVDLTTEYLPDLREETIDRTFAEIRDSLRVIARRRAERVTELGEAIGADVEAIEKLGLEIGALDERLAEEQERLGTLEDEVRERLGRDDDFKELSTAAAYAEERLARNEERIAEIRLEAEEKLPSYEKSDLFMYLVKRRFGQPEYRHRGLIRRLDRWLARHVRFDEFRRSYDFLRVTPEIVEAEVARRRAEFDALMEKVESIERRYADEVGLTAAAARVEQAERELDDRTVARQRREAERAARSDELGRIERHEGRFHAEATMRFRTFLGETKTTVLERHARQTPERTDDRIVASIERCNDALDDLEPELRKLSEDRTRIEDRARELDRMAQRFRHSGYHRRDSEFDDDHDPRREIEAFTDGKASEDEVWSEIERGHRRRRTRRFRSRGTGPFGGRRTSGRTGRSDSTAWVLAESMADVVGKMLSGAARRGVGRRWGGGGGFFGGGRSRGGGGGGRRGGGFSIGDSF